MGKALKISPKNLLDWGSVESWSAGDSSAPDGWTMSGTAGSVAKESTIVKIGTYSMKIISGSSNTYKSSISLSNYDDYENRTIKFGMWAYCGTGSKARIYIDDGVAAQQDSSDHTGGSSWEFLEVEHQISASNTELTFGCEVTSSTITAYFDGGVAVEGDTIFTDLSDYIEAWSPSVKYRNSKFTIARKHGVFSQGVRYDSRSITLKGNVAKTTEALARTAYDAIIKACNSGDKDLYLYDDRFVTGYLTSEKHKYNAAMRMIQFDLKFFCADPFIKYTSKLRSSTTISSSPTSFDFEVNGAVETRPVITFTPTGNTITSCTLENLTTGQSMSFTETVADGDELRIDCDSLEVTNDAVDAIGDFTGDFLKLIPGTNYMKFTGSDNVINIEWKDQWM